MKITALSLLFTLAVLMGLALLQGADTFSLGLRNSFNQLLRFFPVLVVAILVAGFAEALLPRAVIEHWLSDTSGWRGLCIGWLAGILTPGGSIIGLPLVAAMYKTGVGLSVLMTYATSLATLSLLRIPLEVGFYGWRLTGFRVAVSIILPFVAGGLTQLLVRVTGDRL